MKRLLAGLLLAGVLVAMAAPGATAAESLVIRKLDFSRFPRVTISALVNGPTPELSQFALRENGRILTGFEVIPIGQTDTPIGIVLTIDTSGSMRNGNKIEAAKAAARQFVSQKLPNDQVAVVAFDSAPRVVSGFTDDPARLDQAIAGLVATGETALFDGVRTAATLLAERPDLQANIVVLSDGADTVSQNGADEAQASVLSAKAALFAVGLRGGTEFDAGSLTRLAGASGGQYVETTDPRQLSTLYTGVQRALQNQYEINYNSTATGSVEISLAAAGLRATAGPINPGAVSLGPTTKPKVVEPSRFAGLLEGKGALYAVAAVVFLAAALVVAGLVAIGRRERRALDETLGPYGPIPSVMAVPASPELDLAQTALVRRAVDATARLARERGLLQAVEAKLEQADLPVRPAEALFFYGATVLVAAVIGLFLGGPLAAFVTVFFVALTPVALVNALAARRQRLFTAQLPDMLQLLASTLRAGYSLLQGAEAVTEQVGDPMGKELRRVLSEARLGRPLESALEDSARRVASSDYDWAVMAIRIQREVGGNLSELLQTVAETMVARERLRREIRTLTAEGRISAVVLGILPIAIGLVVYLLNPEYLEPLFDRTTGKLMVAGAVVVGAAGFMWMKKIITIET